MARPESNLHRLRVLLVALFLTLPVLPGLAGAEVGDTNLDPQNLFPPNEPSNPSPADGAQGVAVGVILSWTGGDPDGGTVKYTVHLDAGTGTPTTVACANVTVTSCDPGALAHGTDYAWQVVAKDGGYTTTGPVWTFRTKSAPPATPSSPAPADGASGASRDSTLAWTGGDPDSATVTYTVHVENGDPTPDVAACATTTTACDPGRLEPGAAYYWQVWADDGETVTVGPVWSFITALNVPPPAASAPGPADGATGVGTQPTLTWTGGDGDGDAVTYTVLMDLDDPPSTAVCTTTATSCGVGSLARLTTYRWRVLSDDGYAVTAGPVWSFTTHPNSAPAAPSSPTPADGAIEQPSTLTASWTGGDADGDAVTYRVYRDTVDPPTTERCATTSTSCAFSDLLDSTTHYWRVVADDGMDATSGPVWRFTTAARPAEESHHWTFDGGNEGFVREQLQPASEVNRVPMGRVNVTAQRSDPADEMFVRHLGPDDLTDAASFSASARWAATQSGHYQNAFPLFLGADGVTNVGTDASLVSFNHGTIERSTWGDDVFYMRYRDASGVARIATSTNLDGRGPYDLRVDYDAPTRTLVMQIRSTTGSVLASASYVIGTNANDGFTFGKIGIASEGRAKTQDWAMAGWTDDVTFWRILGGGLPPTEPSAPSPADGATGVPRATTLTWTGGDPEGDGVTYTVRVGAGSDRATACVTTTPACAVDGLAYATAHSWQVEATDGVSTTTGPVWTFTTEANAPPAEPSQPAPANGTIGTSRAVTLSWTGGDPNGDAVTYDVYLAQGAGTPTQPLCIDVATTSCAASGLSYATDYSWRVEADDGLDVTSGPVWTFRVRDDPPADTPSAPSPADGATEVPRDAVLSWTSGDPDGEAVSYAVYLEADDRTPDEPVASCAALAQTTCDPGRLDPATTYYWRVEAHDGTTLVTGPVWTFRTEVNLLPEVAASAPADGVTGLSASATFTWLGSEPEGEELHYTLYLDAWNATPETPVETCRGVHATACVVDALEPSTRYYWRVTASDGHESVRTPVRTFTTAWDGQGATTLHDFAANPGLVKGDDQVWSELLHDPLMQDVYVRSDSRDPQDETLSFPLDAPLDDRTSWRVQADWRLERDGAYQRANVLFLSSGALRQLDEPGRVFVGYEPPANGDAPPQATLASASPGEAPSASDGLDAEDVPTLHANAAFVFDGGRTHGGFVPKVGTQYRVSIEYDAPTRLMEIEVVEAANPGVPLDRLVDVVGPAGFAALDTIGFASNGTSSTETLADPREVRIDNVRVTRGAAITGLAAGAFEPAHAARDVPADVVLRWAAESETARYDVYVERSDNVSAPACANVRDACAPGALEPGATYVWRVVPAGGNASEAPLRAFAVARVFALLTPLAAVPAPGETNASSFATLVWDGNPFEDEVFYKVYLGTANPPTELECATFNTWCEPRHLAAGQTYYWQIAAQMGESETVSEIYSFIVTTKEEAAPDVAIFLHGWNSESYGRWRSVKNLLLKEDSAGQSSYNRVEMLGYYGGECYTGGKDASAYGRYAKGHSDNHNKDVKPWQHLSGKKGCNDAEDPKPHGLNVNIEHLAYHVAWYVYKEHTQEGHTVDIVAHSMGGLIARYMLAVVGMDSTTYEDTVDDSNHYCMCGTHNSQRGDWPKDLAIEDVITWGTPHKGTDWNTPCGSAGTQAYQMCGAPETAFVKWLQAHAADPESTTLGVETYWTVIGSYRDQVVTEVSSTGMSKAWLQIRYESPNYDHAYVWLSGWTYPYYVDASVAGNGEILVRTASGNSAEAEARLAQLGIHFLTNSWESRTHMPRTGYLAAQIGKL